MDLLERSASGGRPQGPTTTWTVRVGDRVLARSNGDEFAIERQEIAGLADGPTTLTISSAASPSRNGRSHDAHCSDSAGQSRTSALERSRIPFAGVLAVQHPGEQHAALATR